MDYNYESLLDQRFQMLCQSLLALEFPGLQCLPIAMPDGGRDAITPNHSSKGQIIFQVKYARNPSKVSDAAEWVISAIKGEEGKIKRLIDRGASNYVLVTNMSCTGHLDNGSRDKIQSYLDSNLPCPGVCFWRDDIDRRLDNNYDLKLRYPSLLSGHDMLRLMLEKACAGEGAERRQRALNSYLGHQYNQDKLVRFKQAELPASSLFRLFVDVPAHPPRRRGPRLRETWRQFEGAIRRHTTLNLDSEHYSYANDLFAYYQRSSNPDDRQLFIFANNDYRPAEIGAASLLFEPKFSDIVSQIVIEGAPGQGKSTLAQYIAQVHRFRLLRRPPAGDQISEESLKAPLNLPFKLELRDIAQWLEGFDPWATEAKVEHNKPRALESAIAAHIEKHSGGVSFDAGDFLMILGEVPVLIILDALDEVADLDQRRRVIDEVEACIARLRQQAHQVRFIITSRPTAIADSPSFSDEEFTYLTLAPLPRDLALDYAGRWATARRLSQDDKAEVQRILGVKMSAPHMAELAKNTMQLSILLNLIYVRGESLPDKRTELYDKYIDIFFTRESEKSESVKRHQRLLIDIHRYLGYYLHARAEQDQSTGRISYQELKQVVTDYLLSEGQSTDAIDDLLAGMVQRVVALVSRVEGTYEFEVQPLREYFAARHLYDTASYSPVGRQRSGTKPDRFDGIAKNSYWLNVTRFFCGCFSKGELLDLADRLGELVTEPRFRLLTYPRMLGLALLQDWVFTQSPKATERAISAIFDGFGLRWIGIESYAHGSTRSLADVSPVLSSDTGAYALMEVAWPLINSRVAGEATRELCKYLSTLPLNAQLLELWLEHERKIKEEDRRGWFEIGSALKVFVTATWEDIEDLRGMSGTARASEDDELLACLISGGADLGRNLPDDCSDLAARLVLDQKIAFDTPPHARERGQFIETLRMFTVPEFWMQVGRLMDSGALYEPSSDKSAADISDGMSQLANRVNGIQSNVLAAAKDSPNKLGLWRTITSELEGQFGKSFTVIELGAISGYAAFWGGSYVKADELFNADFTRPDRVRSARKRSGNAEWWLSQLEEAPDSYELLFWAMCAYLWATPECFARIIQSFDSVVRRLDAAKKSFLVSACIRSADLIRQPNKIIPALTYGRLESLDSSTLVILANRIEKTELDKVIEKHLFVDLEAPGAANLVLRFLVSSMANGKLCDEKGLALARRCYAAGAQSRYDTGPSSKRYPLALVRDVLEHSWSFPSDLTLKAIRFGANTLPRTKPVGDIAERENWFVLD